MSSREYSIACTFLLFNGLFLWNDCNFVGFGYLQALQTSTAASFIKGPEGWDEVHHSHHRGAAQELPSLVSGGSFTSGHILKNYVTLLLKNSPTGSLKCYLWQFRIFNPVFIQNIA